MAQTQSIKAVILAAGYGTRLAASGITVPKGLIRCGGTTLISRVVDALEVAGITDIAVVTNDKYLNQYQEWAQAITSAVAVISDGTHSPETRLGALGDLQFTLDRLGWSDSPVLVCPSDTFFAFSLKHFVDELREFPDTFATIVREMAKEDIAGRLGCATLSDTHHIVGFEEKPAVPPSPYAAIPFYFYPAAIHQRLSAYRKAGSSMDAPGNIIPWLLSEKLPVRACVVTEDTLDVGTPAELQQLCP